MSSSPQTTTRSGGTHRASRQARDPRETRDARESRDRAAARNVARRPAPRHEPYLDGLFTYCLSVLCDHDAATTALAEVLRLAERRAHRAPGDPADHRAWLYALARWACLRGLAEARRRRRATHAAGRPAGTGPDGPGTPEDAAAPGTATAEERRRELALLAWPEAAGTTPEQREALELAVRHRLAAHEVAAVLGMEPGATRELLSAAACEVERTRAALAVVETGGCPAVAHLTGDSRMVLSAALRRELVRHVDDCPRCRRTAERAVPGRWPGATVTPAELPVLEAPRAALGTVPAHHARPRGADAPRFDRRGFPMDPKDRAARRERMRARAVTTTVVATVVAAPVLALWAAYRGEPLGEGEAHPPTASEARDPDALAGDTGGYQNAGNAGTRPGTPASDGTGRSDVSVAVVSVGGGDRKNAGRLTVGAVSDGDTTLITLSASGSGPVEWSAATAAPWLRLSRSHGTLEPGASETVKVRVDHLREPSGHWRARVAVAPAGSVVTIDGHGRTPTRSVPHPVPSTPAHPTTPPPTESSTPPPTSESPPPTTPTTPPTDTPTDPPPSTPEEPSSPPPPDDTPSPTGS
ncbi:hypothetical protein KUM39_09520 [Streptomyces sp. J2-1]|uniref:BACON domain-containing protein n=1 Tax=Streptomyces corallincola TaxID=2851888 RepID=UPI001C394202|nr:hypothetical protein [Streptomyces corallincola]MBV2354597.1 hypothetical protein [Streptomyces corallincola]